MDDPIAQPKSNRRSFLKTVATTGIAGLAVAGAPPASASEELDFIFELAHPIVIEDGDRLFVPDTGEMRPPDSNNKVGTVDATWMPRGSEDTTVRDVDGADWMHDIGWSYFSYSNASSAEFGTVSYRLSFETLNDQGNPVDEFSLPWFDLTSPQGSGGGNALLHFPVHTVPGRFAVFKLKLEFDFSDSDIDPGTSNPEKTYVYTTPDRSWDPWKDLIGTTADIWDGAVDIADKTTTVDLSRLERMARIYMALQVAAAGGTDVLTARNDLVANAAIHGISAFEGLIESQEFSVGSHDNLTIEGGGPTFAINRPGECIPVGEYCANDLNGDGLHRDVDDSGTLGSNDVVAFFETVDSPDVQNNPDAFDFNRSGSVGFDDVVALFDQL